MSQFDNINNVGFDLKDYRHASKLYLEGNHRLAPKYKFLYHVVLNINSSARNEALTNQKIKEINILAKMVDLPKFRANVTPVHQYNRKKLVQTGIQYEPIQIEYHDDMSGLTTLLWESYFRYYYADPNYSESDADGPKERVGAYERTRAGLNKAYASDETFSARFGLDRSGKSQPFFNSIQIFQLNTQSGTPTYTAFTLVNPIIEMMEHDTLDQTASEFTINRMTLGYEAVQYHRGYTNVGSSPSGFGESSNYDTEPSQYGSSAVQSSTAFNSLAGNRPNDFTRGTVPETQTQQLQKQSTSPLQGSLVDNVQTTSANGIILNATAPSTSITQARQKDW